MRIRLIAETYSTVNLNVLGGILETTKSKAANKVPFLADIPILGYLFRSTTDINNKTELLIFITPKILREGSNLY